jgi:ATP-dependent protease HslVU (ClpYQ) peptidase subunit
MTCLVGLIDNDRVFICGDSAAVAGDAVETKLNRKVFRNGDYVIGFTGSFRVGQLLQYATLPAVEGDAMAHIVNEVVPILRGFAGKETDEILICVAAVGDKGRLFKISSDYSVAEYPAYTAAGQGEPYALGRLHGSLGAPEQRVVAALAAAEAHCGAVRAPFHIEVC